jgi:hypothetical protein
MIRGSDAGIAQLVEHDLAKVGVASSSLVSRSSFNAKPRFSGVLFFTDNLRSSWSHSRSNGLVAEWSCSGLQIRVRRFDSDLGLHCPNGCDAALKPAAGGFFVGAAGGCTQPLLLLVGQDCAVAMSMAWVASAVLCAAECWKSAGANGLQMKYPCTRSQPSSCRTARCSAVSAPSTIVVMPRRRPTSATPECVGRRARSPRHRWR